MLAALNAMKEKPKVKKQTHIRSTRLDTMVHEPSAVKFIQFELMDGVKSRKYLIANIPFGKSAIENALAYMFDKNMITKKPINPDNPREGMEYKITKLGELK